MLKKIINFLFGKNTENININIKIEDLDKIVEVLCHLSNFKDIISNKDNDFYLNKNSKTNNINIKETSIEENETKTNKKKELKEDPITADDIANLMKESGIDKGIDKTGKIFSESNGSSTDDKISSLKRFKKKG